MNPPCSHQLGGRLPCDRLRSLRLQLQCRIGSGSECARPSRSRSSTTAARPPTSPCPPAPSPSPSRTAAAPKVTELELLNEDGVIIGERENVVEGVPASFSLKLQPGSYKLSCPNGDTTPEGTLKVTGDALRRDRPARRQRSDAGHRRLQASTSITETAKLQTGTADVRRRAQGRRPRRRPRICSARTRIHYEAIEPVAESFGDLDPEIDARINDVADPASGPAFTGSRRSSGSGTATDGHRPVRRQADDRREHAGSEGEARSSYQPAQLANGVGGAAQRGRRIEDHRRGGSLLAHRPVGLPGQPDRRATWPSSCCARRSTSTGNGALATTISERFAAVQTTLDALQALHARSATRRTAS